MPDYFFLLQLACEMAAEQTSRGDLAPHYRALAGMIREERHNVGASTPLANQFDGLFRRLERWRVANGRDPKTGRKIA